jgi:hypothetical protein
MGNAYGNLYVAGGSTAQALTSTPAKLTGFATAGPCSATAGPSGGNRGVVVDAANDKITVKGGGAYKVDFHAGGSTSGAADLTVQLRKGTTALSQGKCIANFATSSVKNSVGFSCIVEIATSEGDVDLSVYGSVSSDVNFTPIEMGLTVTRID